MKNYFGFTHASSFPLHEIQLFYWSIMTAVDSIKCRCAHSGMTGQVGGFQNPGVCLQAFSFLSSPPPLRSFTCAIFRAVFDSRSSFLAPKPHGNACNADYLLTLLTKSLEHSSIHYLCFCSVKFAQFFS